MCAVTCCEERKCYTRAPSGFSSVCLTTWKEEKVAGLTDDPDGLQEQSHLWSDVLSWANPHWEVVGFHFIS